jgi:8-amino-7-oxononanoate synthase
MTAFDRELAQRLEALRRAGLHRELRRLDTPQSPRTRINGQSLLNFSSNDYLGLANHPTLKAAAAEAIARFGTGAGSSRLICGSLSPHHELEASLAAFKRTEACLTFSSGYAAAGGAIGALLGPGDVIILDERVHACIVDAARLSRAKMRVFTHNDTNDLEQILRWARARVTGSRQPLNPGQIMVVTESVFSMDGDQAPLHEIARLKEAYGAWLMVDEAHATGLYGEQGQGLANALNLGHRIEIQMGTLGTALGASGGYICGSKALVEFLINRARTFIFSTAPVPAAAAAATAAVGLVQSGAGASLRANLWKNVGDFHAQRGCQPVTAPGAIVPIVVGGESEAVQFALALRNLGFFVPAIRFPTVARGKARLRVTFSATHHAEEVTALAEALRGMAYSHGFQHP